MIRQKLSGALSVACVLAMTVGVVSLVSSPSAAAAAAPVASAQLPLLGGAGTVALVRHANASNGRHVVTTKTVTEPGVAPERGGVWLLLTDPQPKTTLLTSCKAGNSDQFLSIDPGCEGSTRLNKEGYIYTEPPAEPSVLLYRCFDPSLIDHFVSIHSNCESESGKVRREGEFGYALLTSKIAFTRFVDGDERRDTTGSVGSSYRAETRWFLERAETKGTIPLFGCSYKIPKGVNHMISIHKDCEGADFVREEGWIHGSPPSGVASTPLYRCYRSDVFDHYISSKSDCEGLPTAVNAGRIGYAATRP